MLQTHVIDYLKNKNWTKLQEWLGDFNIMDLQSYMLMNKPEESKVTSFEMILCLLFTEYYKGL